MSDDEMNIDEGMSPSHVAIGSLSYQNLKQQVLAAQSDDVDVDSKTHVRNALDDEGVHPLMFSHSYSQT